jgi:hypothetical protein
MKSWTATFERQKQNYGKMKQTKIKRGGTPFNERGYMSSKTLRSWHSRGGKMYLSHRPLQTTGSI